LRQKILEINQENSSKLQATVTEKETLYSQLESIRNQIGVLEQKHCQELSDWKGQKVAAEEEVRRLNRQLAESGHMLRKCEARVSELERTISHANATLRKMEEQRRELVDSFKKTEDNHRQTLSLHAQRITELSEQNRQADGVIKSMEAKYQKRLVTLQASLDHEHATVISSLQAQLASNGREYMSSIESAKQKYEGEIKNLKEKLHSLDKVGFCFFTFAYLDTDEFKHKI